MRLDEARIAAAAIEDVDVAANVAQHKAMFLAEKNDAGQAIDYFAAVSGGLVLVPTGRRLVQLAEDYRLMIAAGLREGEALAFGELMGRCEALASRVNRGPQTRAG